jgi:hypothetical protein
MEYEVGMKIYILSWGDLGGKIKTSMGHDFEVLEDSQESWVARQWDALHPGAQAGLLG